MSDLQPINQPVRWVADENISLSEYFLGSLGPVNALPGRQITTLDLRQTDALAVRSVTPVTPELLAGTPVKFVGTATIGTDHMDLAGLAAAGVTVASAAGSNAQAVAEYVVTALLTLRPELAHAGPHFCLGIIGLGHVGLRLVRLANWLGWKVLGYDPFKTLTGTDNCFITQTDLTTLLTTAHAISLHVPLTKHGPFATYHMLSAAQFNQMMPDTILLNTARGPVIDEQALLADINWTGRRVILDVFEHEPTLSSTLLEAVHWVTPHIAGYSLEGKARGTFMIYKAFCQWAGLDSPLTLDNQLTSVASVWHATQTKAEHITILLRHLKSLYDIEQDDARLRAGFNPQTATIPAAYFDGLRRDYSLRREWASLGLTLNIN